MHKWYGQAKLCLAYLSDVDGWPFQAGEPMMEPGLPFAQSRWFTRGRTLQELLAPPEVIFYDKVWNDMGARSVLKLVISDITGIDPSALGGSIPDEFSITQKMSWAAKRETTRPKDLADCLLGLFDINMPIIYGKGTKALERLQLEIIKFSDDQSLFAWHFGSVTPVKKLPSGSEYDPTIGAISNTVLWHHLLICFLDDPRSNA